jgi:hypothetical protein
MPIFQKSAWNRPSASLWRKAGALLCLLLLVALTTVAVAHVHHDGPGNDRDAGDAHCQLCQLSHSPATTPAQLSAVLYLAVTALLVCISRIQWLDRVAVRDVTTRPPPSSL